MKRRQRRNPEAHAKKGAFGLPPHVEEIAALAAGAGFPIAVGIGLGGPLVPTALALLALGVTLNGGNLKGSTSSARLAQGALASTAFGAVWNVRKSADEHGGRVGPSDIFRLTERAT